MRQEEYEYTEPEQYGPFASEGCFGNTLNISKENKKIIFTTTDAGDRDSISVRIPKKEISILIDFLQKQL